MMEKSNYSNGLRDAFLESGQKIVPTTLGFAPPLNETKEHKEE